MLICLYQLPSSRRVVILRAPTTARGRRPSLPRLAPLELPSLLEPVAAVGRGGAASSSSRRGVLGVALQPSCVACAGDGAAASFWLSTAVAFGAVLQRLYSCVAALRANGFQRAISEMLAPSLCFFVLPWFRVR